jgi:hypothetical protein
MAMKPPNQKGALQHAPIPKLRMRVAYGIATLLATVFGGPFWLFEQRRWRLADLLDNERGNE